jgi:SAM-dependent methyltransferase
MLSPADVADGRKPIGAVSVERAQPLAMWTAGLVVSLRTLRKEPVLGLKRLVLPVSYWRATEFAYAWEQLNEPAGARILDVGSPKDLAAMLARHKGYEVIATDILPEAVLLSRRYAHAQGLDGTGPGRVHSEVQDGRALPYASNSFDAAYSVSVLEHIPERGDSAAIRELIRVVKPGGVVVVTVPYDRVYRETFVKGNVYERKASGTEPIFFERHYDREALADRLLGSQRADVVDFSVWGEGTVRMETVLNRLGPLRTLVSPLEALFSTLLLRQVEPDGPGHPMAAFFTLRRR